MYLTDVGLVLDGANDESSGCDMGADIALLFGHFSIADAPCAQQTRPVVHNTPSRNETHVARTDQRHRFGLLRAEKTSEKRNGPSMSDVWGSMFLPFGD
jgi:hypothetical protein